MIARTSRLILSALLSVSFASAAMAKGKKGQYVEMSYDKLQWNDVPGTPLKVAVLWGNPEKGAHGRYLKLPGGFEAGMHSHSSPYHGVLISGTWMHWEEGTTTPTELSAGSYVMQPGKKNHADKCKEGSDCVVLIVQPGKSDYIPAKAPEKK
ncbi:MAG: hypothetical protein RL189_2445 [Pseudomonadota bacterium]